MRFSLAYFVLVKNTVNQIYSQLTRAEEEITKFGVVVWFTRRNARLGLLV